MIINKNILVKALIFFTFLFVQNDSSAQTVYNKLVWSDEFDYNGLPDSSKWGYDKGKGCPDNCGWGNNELQFYTWNRHENARVEDGKLTIEARKENYSGAAYTSARLVCLDIILKSMLYPLLRKSNLPLKSTGRLFIFKSFFSKNNCREFVLILVTRFACTFLAPI